MRIISLQFTVFTKDYILCLLLGIITVGYGLGPSVDWLGWIGVGRKITTFCGFGWVKL